jgi:putative ABC transport system permease protein
VSFQDALLQALRHLRAHKLRALLTLFGLVWGTASVIFLVAWGEGVTQMLERGFAKTGKNLGQFFAGRIGEDFTPAVDRRYLWYTQDDVDRLRRRARLPELIGAQTHEHLPLALGQRALNVDVRGMDPEAIAIRGVAVATGRTLSQMDLSQHRRVVVLGHDVRQKLLGARGGIGAWVRVAGQPFQVVGVLTRMGDQLGRDGDKIDDQAWIPISTFRVLWPRWWTDQPWVDSILYRLRDRHLRVETEREMRSILAEGLGVRSTDTEAVLHWSSLELLSQLPLDQMRGVLFALAAATLVIGGIGTLNLMLDSVHERRQEIGVRLAVGARRRDVTLHFFLETLCVVALGGLLGVALGLAGCALLASLDFPDLVPVPVLSWRVVALALAVMTAVGFGAGVVPAWRAAQVDPAVTLRME